jgi:hypothetical protein
MAHEMTVDGVELMPDFPLLTRPTCPMLHLTASNSVRDVQTMTQAVVEHYQDHLGRLGYALFQAVQTTLFAGELPWPLILWGLTAHGHCLAWTRAGDRPPMILLHPSLLGGTEKERPWGLPDGWLGGCSMRSIRSSTNACMWPCIRFGGSGKAARVRITIPCGLPKSTAWPRSSAFPASGPRCPSRCGRRGSWCAAAKMPL